VYSYSLKTPSCASLIHTQIAHQRSNEHRCKFAGMWHTLTIVFITLIHSCMQSFIQSTPLSPVGSRRITRVMLNSRCKSSILFHWIIYTRAAACTRPRDGWIGWRSSASLYAPTLDQYFASAAAQNNEQLLPRTRYTALIHENIIRPWELQSIVCGLDSSAAINKSAALTRHLDCAHQTFKI